MRDGHISCEVPLLRINDISKENHIHKKRGGWDYFPSHSCKKKQNPFEGK